MSVSACIWWYLLYQMKTLIS